MYSRILVAVEHSAKDRTILDHVAKLAQLTKAELLLVHVADGFAARHFDDLKLRESEEMKADRTYLESLRNRCSRYGVNVVTIKPGFVDTAMTRGMKGLFWLISAEQAAKTSLALARKGKSGSAFVPARWWLVATIVKSLPSFIFRKLNF